MVFVFTRNKALMMWLCGRLEVNPRSYRYISDERSIEGGSGTIIRFAPEQHPRYNQISAAIQIAKHHFMVLDVTDRTSC